MSVNVNALSTRGSAGELSAPPPRLASRAETRFRSCSRPALQGPFPLLSTPSGPGPRLRAPPPPRPGARVPVLPQCCLIGRAELDPLRHALSKKRFGVVVAPMSRVQLSWAHAATARNPSEWYTPTASVSSSRAAVAPARSPAATRIVTAAASRRIRTVSSTRSAYPCLGYPRLSKARSPGDIEKKPEQLPDLPQGSRPDIASRAFDSPRRHRSNVLALSRRQELETVRIIGIDLDLGGEPSKRRSEGDNLHNTRFCVEDSLCCHHDDWMAKPRFSSCGRTEIQVDDITRGQHRANQPLRRSDQREGRLRSGPGEADEPQERRSRPRSPPKTQPGP